MTSSVPNGTAAPQVNSAALNHSAGEAVHQLPETTGGFQPTTIDNFEPPYDHRSLIHLINAASLLHRCDSSSPVSTYFASHLLHQPTSSTSIPAERGFRERRCRSYVGPNPVPCTARKQAGSKLKQSGSCSFLDQVRGVNLSPVH